MVRVATRSARIKSRNRYGNPLLPYLLLSPSLAVLLLFTFWPAIHVGWLSLFRDNLASNGPQYTGLTNFATILSDPVFKTVLFNTVEFVVGTAVPAMALGLGMALLLNQQRLLTPLYRVAFFYPTLLPMIGAATAWAFIYTPQYGLLDRVLHLWGASTGGSPLGNPNLALPALIALSIWRMSGYLMIFFLAGLQGIPNDIQEAARVDGASYLTVLRRIIIPLLGPTFVFVVIISIVNTAQMVDQLYVTTSGGPNNATNLLLWAIYQETFSFQDSGIAAAMTVILVSALLVCAALNAILLDRRTHYDN
jgi:sn-glycerol 3-phosphate transport system permease protein